MLYIFAEELLESPTSPTPMPGKRGKKGKFKKALIVMLKWVSALVPVLGFIYILYYYKQLDFLKEKPVVKSKTEVVGQVDSISISADARNEEELRKIKVLENEWHSVGGIAIHNITIANSTSKTLSSVEVEFKYLSDTQAVITSKIVSVKAKIAPGKSAKVSGISVGYVNNNVVGCDTKVVNVKY